MAEGSTGKMASRPIGTARVDITRQEHKKFAATYTTEEISLSAHDRRTRDARRLRFGPDAARLFHHRRGYCLMMRYGNVLKERPMPVESVKMVARAHNDLEARIFTDTIYQVDRTGSISEADGVTLAEAACERCFVENSFAKALPITTEVSLNGEKVVSFTRIG